MSTLPMFPTTSDEVIDSSDQQNTPRDLCLDLGWFDLDPCSNPASSVLARATYSLEQGLDGLAEPWVGSVWCNGEYSNPLPWCERLAAHNGPWCSLWKLDPTTTWWAVLMGAADGYGMFKRRLKFSKASGSNAGVANFGSVLVWGGGWSPPAAVLARMWPACAPR